MALVLQDRVSVNSTGSGTSDLALGSAYPGYRSFTSCIPDGSIVYYTISNQAVGYDTEWEVGYGKYSLGTNTLIRNNGNSAETGVYSSSNANTYVNFTAGTNGLQIFITQPSEQAVYQQVNGDTVFNEGVLTVQGPNVTSYTTLTNSIGQFFANQNDYAQINMQNQSSGNVASSDYIATADDGTATTNYVDLGINGSGFADPTNQFTIVGANGAYLYASDDELAIGTANTQPLKFFVNGTLLASEVGRFSSGGNFILYSGASPTDNGQKLQVIGNAAITGATTFGSTVTLNANPSAALEAATKAYVDQQTSTGIHIHTPCTSEISAALSAVYTQGGTTFNITDITGGNTVVTSTTHGLSVNDEIWLTTTAGNGLSTNTAYFVYATPTTTSLQLSTTYGGPLLTGLTNASGLSYATRANSGVGAYLEASANQALPIGGVIVGDRVLVYQQSTGYWNGIYTVTSLGANDPGGSKWKLTRASDANKYEPDNTTGMGAGDYFFIQSNSEAYVLTNPTGPIIIGYDAITYTLFSSVPIYTGTSPINVSGSVISLDVVPTTLGGTNLSSYTTGDTIYASGTNVLSKRAIGNTGNTLLVSGGVPTWGALDLSSANAVSSTLGATNGGTGQSTYTLGDIIYANASNTLAKLPGQTTVTKKYLSQTGDGVNSAAPAWSQVAAADISGLAPSATTDTSNASNITSGTLPTGRISGSYTGLTGTGTLTVGTWNANVIGATYGGTGVAGTITGIPYANGASAYTAATASDVVTLLGSTAVANATYAVSSNSSTYTSNILGGAAGSIPYQNGANSTSLLATGSGVLVGGTTPAWSTAPTLTGTNFSGIPNSATTATAANTASAIVARDASGNFTAGAITSTSISGSGAGLTTLNASNLASGTIPSGVLGNSSLYIGTTAVPLNAGSGSITSLAVNISGSAASASTATNVAAANLTGSTLSSNVTASSLTSLGTLTGLSASSGSTTTAANVTSSGSTAGLLVTDTGASGANVKLAGNGATTPNKTIRAQGGNFSIVNNAYTTEIFTLSDAGVITNSTWNGASIATTYTAAKVTDVQAGTGISVSATTGSVSVSIPQAVATTSSVQFGSFGVGTAASGTAGEIRATNNVTAYYSDERLKTKVGNIENALDKVNQIETMVYHANETAVSLGYDASIIEVGVTAQSVQKVMPQTVAPAPIDDKYLTVRYERLVPLLIEAIKELKAEVDALKGK